MGRWSVGRWQHGSARQLFIQAQTRRYLARGPSVRTRSIHVERMRHLCDGRLAASDHWPGEMAVDHASSALWLLSAGDPLWTGAVSPSHMVQINFLTFNVG